MNVNSHIIKVCLMKYYRFKRQFICCDEIGLEPADVLVDTGNKIIEVEIKISKQDLWKDSFKKKHKRNDINRGVNQFILCTTHKLKDEALKWIEETNKKYGLILFDEEYLENKGYYHWKNYLITYKRAKNLNNKKFNRSNEISKRLCSALTNSYERIIN